MPDGCCRTVSWSLPPIPCRRTPNLAESIGPDQLKRAAFGHTGKTRPCLREDATMPEEYMSFDCKSMTVARDPRLWRLFFPP